MAQDPFKVDQLQFEPGSGDTILIRRHSDGSLKFTDALVTDVVLSQLVNLSTIEGVRIVGRAGYAQYTSIQDALDTVPSGSSAANPYLVLVLPGVYAEDITLIRDGVTILGLGTVVLQSLLEATPDASGATHTLTIASSGTTPLKVDLVNLTITNAHAAKACIYATGATLFGGATGCLRLKDCNLSATSASGNFTLALTCVNKVRVDGGTLGGGELDQLKLYEVADFEARRVSAIGAVLCRWDDAATLPSSTVVTHLYQNCDISLNSLLTNSFVLTDDSAVTLRGCNIGATNLDGNRTVTFENCMVGALSITALSTCAVVSTRTGFRSTLPSNATATLALDNLSGALTFTGTAAESVVFDTPQPDTSFYVQLTVEGDSSGECPYISAKSSTGFTVTYNTVQTLTTRWRLFR